MLTPRQLAVFASAFVLAAAALAGAWMTLGSDVWPLPVQPKTSVAAATQAAAPASQEIAACPLEPAAAVAGEKDGRFPLQSDVSGLIAADIASFIVFGKEAAAAGRPRDAEVAFLMSCRVADQFKGAASVQSADARYQLGSHYARLVFNGSLAAGASRAELLNRAERLYADSLHTYGANHGEADEKSRFAAEGLARVRQTLAQAQTVQAAPVRPVPAPAQPAREAVATTTEPARSAGESTSKPSRGSVSRSQPRDAEDAQAAAAAPKVAPPAPDAAMRSGPSFNCAKARSVSEVIICSDPQLTELDRDLSRVYARARKAASDPAAFQRRSDEEWRLRESICRNRECLLRWYAQRHEQLMNDLQGRKQPQSTAYR